MTRDRASTLCAVLLAAVVLWLGVQFGSTSAGGADSAGYITQAGLWQTGSLTVHQDVVASSPWPFAPVTWAPLGFVPSPTTRDAVVPSYAPGYPLLIALAQIVAGYCAGFLVVPIAGALTIAATCALGRRVFASHTIALGAAVLVACSPPFLYQLMNPMSDVPVTAAWTSALVFAAWNLPLCAGLATAAAIAIRPNLAPLAAVLFAWLAMTNRRGLLRAAIGVAPAIVGIAWLNARLYGSPLVSGYGTLADIYAWAHGPANLRLFAAWTLDVETPLVLLAVVAIAAPRLTAPSRVPAAAVLLTGTVAVVLVSYLFYQPFDVWWYLRFLLPAWPALLLLAAAGLDAVVRRWAAPFQVALTAAVLAGWAGCGLWIAESRGVFELGRGERIYVDIGRFVAAHTEPDAVIFSFQHSGSIRLYADRLVLRYERLEPAWLDRAIAHLQGSGHHPYFVLTESEEAEFTRRFASASPVGALDWKPIAVSASPRVAIYDAVNRSTTATTMGIAVSGRGPARWRCDPPQIWPQRLRMK